MMPIPRRAFAPHSSTSRINQNTSDSLVQIARSLRMLTDRMNDIYENRKKHQNGDMFHNQSQVRRMQERFQKVQTAIPTLLPRQPQYLQERTQQIQEWLGKLCQQVFSITFSLFEYEKLNDSKTKSFCCQNMLSNIIKMIKKNKLTAEQISHMDDCLKNQLIPYFLIKYPISEEAEINLQFQSKIVQIDSIQDNQNDLIFKSKIEFNYNHNGNYNRQIMRFFNYLIELPNAKVNNNQTLFKVFFNQMEDFFKKIQTEEFTLVMSKYDFRDTSSNNIPNLNDSIMNALGKINSIEQQKQKQKYIQTVRSYTNKRIGRKISENIKPFTDLQINQGQLILKNPSLMRIMTKWCEQLMANFQIAKNILNKEEQFRMKDGSQKILKRRHLLVLAELLKRQKNKVNEYLKKVNENNSQCHFDFGHQPIPKKMRKFCEQEYEVGHFAASTINNYQTYLVGYINTIIHSLMSAVKDYQEMVKAYEYKQQQYGQYIQQWRKGSLSFQDLISRAYSYRLASVPDSYYSFIPQLVSFRVGDIMRCRCISKQKQIIALYTEIERISRKSGSQMKIMRIKNRLSKGTKDILINILYRNKMLIQMQLGIAMNVSKFIDFSNKFNHTLYELKRSQFGAISQMCNIWINNDIKSEFYINYTKTANDRHSKLDTSSHICKGIPIQFPFRCTECQYFYNDCSYALKHLQCTQKKCEKLICSLCRCQRLDYLSIKSIWHQIPGIEVLGMKDKQKYQVYRNKIIKNRVSQQDFMQGIERSGMLLDLKGEDLKPIFYKSVKHGKKTMIVQITNFQTKEMKVIKQLIFHSQIKAFKKEYLMFVSNKLTQMIKPAEGEILMRVITEYNFPKLMKKWYQKQKATIVFMNGGLLDSDLEKVNFRYPFATKVCFYQNKITNIENVMRKFQNSEIVDLGQNSIRIMEIKDKHDFTQNSLKVLYANYNNLEQISTNFIELFHQIEELELANNCIKSLPSNFFNLSKLKILNLSRNLFQILPVQVTKLQQLQCLYLYSAKDNLHKKLISLPETFGKLKNLKKVNLNFNNLVTLPNSIGDLENLETLYVVQNKLKNLPESFKKLKKLKVLNLAQNQFDELPKQIGELISLQILNLENSSKNDIPDKILPGCYTDLVRMKMMDVSQNNLTSLPAELGKMKKLQTLFIYENKLKQIPESIGDLKLLRLLYASNNQLKRLPDSICKLQNLQKLTVKQNAEMEYLPEHIGNLKKLKFLIASNDCLRAVPDSLGELQSLQELLLKGNKITSLPSSMKKLTELTRFQIDSQKLNTESRKMFNL